MSLGSNINPLDIPEIRSMVGQYLGRPDLTRCLRVSKSWHASFVPLVWSAISVREEIWGADAGNPPPEVFLRHSHYLKDLDLNIDAPQELRLTPCPNLLNLIVRICRIDESKSMIIVPVVIAPYEQLHRLSIWNTCTVPLRVFWKPVHYYHNLSELDLKYMEIEPTGTTAFWVLCAQLVSLKIWYVTVVELPARSITFDRLQHLKLWLGSQIPIERQLDWITQCPNLTSLEWSDGTDDNQPTSQFMRRFVPGTWPHLSELSLSEIEFTDAQLSQVIGAMQGLKSLSVHICDVGSCFLEALRHHSHTLISLDTTNCEVLTRSLVPGILTSFPHLETLSAHPVMSEDIINSPPWVCEHSLKVLHIGFMETPDQDAEYHQQVLQRISRLTNLKEIRLLRGPQSRRTLDFTLENGLEQFATWKQLEIFDVFSRTARFSVRDVEWMINNWKNLKRVSGILHPDKKKEFTAMFQAAGIEYRTW
ncbi:MAG: hypothetical protein J3Q66DRAFT_443818 [Benniella sp.]|nr:MAG: hypothetical protein J3Q66DRAFT_443818 [Benniella sp.]